LGQIVNEPTFRDVCTPRGKWFRGRENCFVAASATKQLDLKIQQFELDKFWGDLARSGPKACGNWYPAWNCGLI
jgi:hypothetical protein